MQALAEAIKAQTNELHTSVTSMKDMLQNIDRSSRQVSSPTHRRRQAQAPSAACLMLVCKLCNRVEPAMSRLIQRLALMSTSQLSCKRNAILFWLTVSLDAVQAAVGGQHQSPSLSLGELRNELRTFAATLNE